MDLLKYIVVGAGCLFLGIIIAIIAKNILAGLGFFVLGLSVYILWNYFNSAKKDVPSNGTNPTSSDNEHKDN